MLRYNKNDYALPKVGSHRSITLDPLNHERSASKTDTDEEERTYSSNQPAYEETPKPPIIPMEFRQPKTVIKVGSYQKKQQMNELYRENNKIAQTILEIKPSIDNHKLLEDFR